MGGQGLDGVGQSRDRGIPPNPPPLGKTLQRVKYLIDVLQSESSLFRFIILNLPLQSYIWLSKNFSKPTSKNEERGCFNFKNQCTAGFVSKAFKKDLFFRFNFVDNSGKCVLYSY